MPCAIAFDGGKSGVGVDAPRRQPLAARLLLHDALGVRDDTTAEGVAQPVELHVRHEVRQLPDEHAHELAVSLSRRRRANEDVAGVRHE